MDRVIKFRAWDKDLKEFRKILNIKIVNGIPVSCVFAGSEDGNNFEKSIVAWDGATSIVLEQFTGLLDKNGTEIYEGDIIKHNNNRFVVCIMENMGMCLIDIKKYDGGKSLVYTKDNWRDWTWVFNIKKYLEVIGNIHTSTQGVETKTN